MRKMKWLVLSLLITMTLVSCRSRNTGPVVETAEMPEEKIVVATNMTNLVNNKLKDLAEEFMRSHPGKVVEFEGIKDYEGVLANRIAGGEPPDIYFVLDIIETGMYHEYFLPLDDLPFDAETISYYDNYRGSDGHVYGLSTSVDYNGIVYNKKAFETAGIKQVPRTREEFFEVCRKLKEADIIPFGTAPRDVWPMHQWVDWRITQVVFNGDIRGKNKYSEQNQIFDETEVGSMNYLKDMYRLGYLENSLSNANWDQLKRGLSDGTVAMTYSATWLPRQLVDLGSAEEEIGMFAFPDSKAIASTSGKVWGIAKETKYPQLGKDFLEYMVADGRYAKACGIVPSVAADAPEDIWVDELMSSGLTVLEPESAGDRFIKIYNAADIEEQRFLMNYITADDEQAATMVREANQAWAEARARVIPE